MNQAQLIFRVTRSDENAEHACNYLFLHGYTGDENSMNIFSRNLHHAGLKVFPRAPYQAEPQGYSWIANFNGKTRSPDDFSSSAHILWQSLIAHFGPEVTWRVCGFSQGAAMALILTMLHPARIIKTACLSGAYPPLFDSQLLGSLTGKSIYIAHGNRDSLSPVETARETSSLLMEIGAEVNYCENEGGHKLPLSCLKGLQEYFSSPC